MTSLARKKNKVSYYMLAEASRILNVNPSTVHKWLIDGTLRQATEVQGRIRLIDAESVEQLKRERELNPPKRGRKPKAN